MRQKVGPSVQVLPRAMYRVKKGREAVASRSEAARFRIQMLMTERRTWKPTTPMMRRFSIMPMDENKPWREMVKTLKELILAVWFVGPLVKFIFAPSGHNKVEAMSRSRALLVSFCVTLLKFAKEIRACKTKPNKSRKYSKLWRQLRGHTYSFIKELTFVCIIGFVLYWHVYKTGHSTLTAHDYHLTFMLGRRRDGGGIGDDNAAKPMTTVHVCV